MIYPIYMAIGLQEVNSKSNSHEGESLLDKILRHKERKLILKQKGPQKKFIQRPWENSKSVISKRVKSKKVMKPFLKSKVYTEQDLLDLITKRAKILFSKIDLSNL